MGPGPLHDVYMNQIEQNVAQPWASGEGSKVKTEDRF